MATMNSTLWATFDLPGHLSKLMVPRLGTVEVEVVGHDALPNSQISEISEIPVGDFVATVKYNGTTHVTRKRASRCSDNANRNCFTFGGWSGVHGPAQHNVEVVAPGYRDQVVNVSVRGNLTQRLTVTMSTS